MIDYEDTPAPSDEQLATVAKLAFMQLEAEKVLATKEREYKQAKDALFKIQERELPEAMLALGMESFTLKSGEKISVKETLYASVAKKNKQAAIAWLMDNDHGEIVKENVLVPFEKGQHDDVLKVVEMLEAIGVSNYAVDETINTATIKSLIKELLASGVEVPLDLFGAHFARKAEVKI